MAKPITHQGRERPAMKQSSMLPEARRMKYSPTASESSRQTAMTSQSRVAIRVDVARAGSALPCGSGLRPAAAGDRGRK